jgi:methionyl-tRNA synthetase
VHVARHPHADTLYVEKIDVGEPAPRTIISGLVKYMKESELESKLVLVLCNLPSKEVRSIASHGMVLAASQTNSATGESKIALIEPPQNSTPGEAVFVDGEVSEILQGISGNRLEKILKKCKVDDKGVATFTTGDGSLKPIQTSTGSCTSTLSNASIS